MFQAGYLAPESKISKSVNYGHAFLYVRPRFRTVFANFISPSRKVLHTFFCSFSIGVIVWFANQNWSNHGLQWNFNEKIEKFWNFCFSSLGSQWCLEVISERFVTQKRTRSTLQHDFHAPVFVKIPLTLLQIRDKSWARSGNFRKTVNFEDLYLRAQWRFLKNFKRFGKFVTRSLR